MSLKDLDLDLEAMKEVASREHQSCLDARRNLLDEHSASFRWLMASLLAINLGGLAILNGLSGTPFTHTVVAGLAFTIGIACSLLVAVIGQKSIQRMVEPLSHAVAFWSIVAASGEFIQEEFDRIGERINLSMSLSNKPRLFGVLSFLAFVAGLVTVALAEAEKVRCIDQCKQASETPSRK